MIAHCRAVGSTGAVLVLLIPVLVALSIAAPLVTVIGGPPLSVAGGVILERHRNCRPSPSSLLPSSQPSSSCSSWPCSRSPALLSSDPEPVGWGIEPTPRGFSQHHTPQQTPCKCFLHLRRRHKRSIRGTESRFTILQRRQRCSVRFSTTRETSTNSSFIISGAIRVAEMGGLIAAASVRIARSARSGSQLGPFSRSKI